MSHTAEWDQNRSKEVNSSMFCLFLLEEGSVLAYLVGDTEELCRFLLLAQKRKRMEGQLSGPGDSCGSFWAVQEPSSLLGRQRSAWVNKRSKTREQMEPLEAGKQAYKTCKVEITGLQDTAPRMLLQQQSQMQVPQCAGRAVPLTTGTDKS